MKNTADMSFEDLVTEQSDALIGSPPKDFDVTWRKIAQSVLDWFEIDRVTLFPNSMIILNDGKVSTVSRDGIPELKKTIFINGNYLDYFKQLRTKKSWLTFDDQEMSNHKISVIQTLHAEGGRWHGIIPLKLFAQDWGALSFSRFTSDLEPATVSPERPTAENKETQPTRVLCMNRLSYRSCFRISPSNNSSMPTIIG